MITLTEADVQAIMQSDMKLWETADTTEPSPGTIVKSMHLPFGIGECNTTLEGLTDAIKKRAAVAQYGEYIRSLIKDRTDDEAIEARAKQAAARTEERDSRDSILVDSGGVPVSSGQEAVESGSEDAYVEDAEDDATFGEALAVKRATLRERIGRTEANLARWRRECKALDAALAALEEDDAPTDSKPPETSPAGKMGEV